jgi:hypothetical protein
MISTEFINYLQDEGFGTVGTDIFESLQPDNPNNCITVYNYNSPSISESSSLSVDQYAIQIIVRNVLSDNARNIIWNIHNNFMGYSGILPNANYFISMVFSETPPYAIGKDSKGRQEYTATYRMRVQTEGNKYRL